MRDAAPTRPRVLLVEDERVSREALHRLLVLSGYDTTSVGTVAGALAKLSAKAQGRPPYPCVVLDLMLPDGPGTAVLERLRAGPGPVRVAITTGTDDPALLEAARRLNPDVLMEKPIQLARLVEWLEACHAGP